MNTIIGIDPGPSESAYVILRENVILAKSKVVNGCMLSWIKQMERNEMILVIEQIACFGMSVGAEVFETVFWSGRFAQAWNSDFHRIKRHEVKMHLCHNMRAKDANIRQALIDRYGGKEKAIGKKKTPGPLFGISGDCWSALAVAIVFADRLKERGL